MPPGAGPLTAPTNGGSQGRIVEHVDGQVAAANEHGVKPVGEDAYRNFSKWADPPIAPASRGAHVRLALDAAGFVRQLQVLDEAAPSAPSAADRERIMTRLSVLRSAAIFCAGYAQVHEDVKSTDVVKVAEAWEQLALASEEG